MTKTMIPTSTCLGLMIVMCDICRLPAYSCQKRRISKLIGRFNTGEYVLRSSGIGFAEWVFVAQG